MGDSVKNGQSSSGIREWHLASQTCLRKRRVERVEKLVEEENPDHDVFAGDTIDVGARWVRVKSMRGQQPFQVLAALANIDRSGWEDECWIVEPFRVPLLDYAYGMIGPYPGTIIHAGA